ncbi:hypothetical protein BGX26_012656, partial [Mortierella sp. AD094]
ELPKRAAVALYHTHTATTLHQSELPKHTAATLYHTDIPNYAAVKLHHSELPTCKAVAPYHTHTAATLHHSELPTCKAAAPYHSHKAATLHRSGLPTCKAVAPYHSHAATTLHHSELPKRTAVALYHTHTAATLHQNELPKHTAATLYHTDIPNYAAVKLHHSELPSCKAAALYHVRSTATLHRSELPKRVAVTLHHTDIPDYAAVTLHRSELPNFAAVTLHGSEFVKRNHSNGNNNGNSNGNSNGNNSGNNNGSISGNTNSGGNSSNNSGNSSAHAGLSLNGGGRSSNKPTTLNRSELSREAQLTQRRVSQAQPRKRTNIVGVPRHNRKPSKKQRKAAKKLEVLSQLGVMDSISNILVGRRKNSISSPIMQLDRFFDESRSVPEPEQRQQHDHHDHNLAIDPVASAVVAGIEGIKSFLGNIHVPAIVTRRLSQQYDVAVENPFLNAPGADKAPPVVRVPAPVTAKVPVTPKPSAITKAHAATKVPAVIPEDENIFGISCHPSTDAHHAIHKHEPSKAVMLKAPKVDQTLLPEEQAVYPREDCDGHENPARPEKVFDIMEIHNYTLECHPRPFALPKADRPIAEPLIPTAAVAPVLPMINHSKLNSATGHVSTVASRREHRRKPSKSVMLKVPRVDLTLLPEEQAGYPRGDFNKQENPLRPVNISEIVEVDYPQMGFLAPTKTAMQPDIAPIEAVSPLILDSGARLASPVLPARKDTARHRIPRKRAISSSTSAAVAPRELKKSRSTAVALKRPRINLFLYPEEQPDYPLGNVMRRRSKRPLRIPEPVKTVASEIQLDPAHQHPHHDLHPTIAESAAAVVTQGLEGIMSLLANIHLPNVLLQGNIATGTGVVAATAPRLPRHHTLQTSIPEPLYLSQQPSFAAQARHIPLVPVSEPLNNIQQEPAERPTQVAGKMPRRKLSLPVHKASESESSTSSTRQVTIVEPRRRNSLRVSAGSLQETLFTPFEKAPDSEQQQQQQQLRQRRVPADGDGEEYPQSRPAQIRRKSTYGVSHEVDPLLYKGKDFDMSSAPDYTLKVEEKVRIQEVEKISKLKKMRRPPASLQSVFDPPTPVEYSPAVTALERLHEQSIDRGVVTEAKEEDSILKADKIHHEAVLTPNPVSVLDTIAASFSAKALYSAISSTLGVSPLQEREQHQKGTFVPSGHHRRNMTIHSAADENRSHMSGPSVDTMSHSSALLARKFQPVSVLPPMASTAIFSDAMVLDPRPLPAAEKYRERHSHRREFNVQAAPQPHIMTIDTPETKIPIAQPPKETPAPRIKLPNALIAEPTEDKATVARHDVSVPKPQTTQPLVPESVSVPRIVASERPVMTQENVSEDRPFTFKAATAPKVALASAPALHTTPSLIATAAASVTPTYAAVTPTYAAVTTPPASDMHFHLPHHLHRHRDDKEQKDSAKHNTESLTTAMKDVSVKEQGHDSKAQVHSTSQVDQKPYPHHSWNLLYDLHEPTCHVNDKDQGHGHEHEHRQEHHHHQEEPQHKEPHQKGEHPHGTEIYNVAAPHVAPFIGGEAAMQTSLHGWNMAELHYGLYKCQPERHRHEHDEHHHHHHHHHSQDEEKKVEVPRKSHKYESLSDDSSSGKSSTSNEYAQSLRSTTAPWTSHEEPDKIVAPAVVAPNRHDPPCEARFHNTAVSSTGVEKDSGLSQTKEREVYEAPTASASPYTASDENPAPRSVYPKNPNMVAAMNTPASLPKPAPVTQEFCEPTNSEETLMDQSLQGNNHKSASNVFRRPMDPLRQ